MVEEVMRSNSANAFLFIFQLENISRSYLTFDRLRVLIKVTIGEFRLREKHFIGKIFYRNIRL